MELTRAINIRKFMRGDITKTFNRADANPPEITDSDIQPTIERLTVLLADV